MTKFFSLSPGDKVLSEGCEYEISHVLDCNAVVGISTETGHRDILRVSTLTAARDGANAVDPISLSDIPDHRWEQARFRHEVIRPLLGRTNRTRSEVESIARKHNVGASSIYRWLSLFEDTGTLLSLVPQERSGGYDKPRISAEAEAIIKHHIEHSYLTTQKPSPSFICEEVLRSCKQAGIKPPHPSTIRKRISRVSARVKAERRGDRRASERMEATPGTFPDAHWPLQVVQIDHTPVDLMVVDDTHRQSIGRPWITVAIDVYSRMVTGFLVTLDPPSALSVGLVIAQSMLPKDQWLAERELDLEWPVWGKPDSIHADNGADFRCAAVTKGCENQLIDIHWRPVKKPRFGAHIERLLGTIARRMKNLEGATFSNVNERGDYDSDARAQFTLRELEQWLAHFLLGEYHNKRHSGLGIPPLKKFQDGILGSKDTLAAGLPAKPADPRSLQIDFLPITYRTVQSTGISLEGIRYFGEALRKWVGVVDTSSGKSRKFEVRYDPRNMARVLFWDPDSETYHDIPTANLSRAHVSLWEIRAARRKLLKEGKPVNEAAIFKSIDEMERIQVGAAKKTKSARRSVQRRAAHKESTRPPPSPPPRPHSNQGTDITAGAGMPPTDLAELEVGAYDHEWD
ncbi:Mu transposase C-terminal domain-containing protein [Algiphilus sp.]|uniref:Mu transposase C-terminal domain-containing protein n=1 Tax=Algiphilus sp. TaxID=1872431 RepID=UPI003B51D4C6